MEKMDTVILVFLHLRYGLDEDDIVILDSKDEFLLPGFIDSHIHASQFPNAGTKLLSMFPNVYKLYLKFNHTLQLPCCS